MYRHILALPLVLASLNGFAECPSREKIDQMTQEWTTHAPLHLGPMTSLDDAQCTRERLVEQLTATQGKRVGYKAGLTNKAVQKRFGYDAPILGVLLEKMLLPDHIEVAARFGSRPLMEADLIVEIGDEGVNAARTPEEVMSHLTRIFPFIELPDLALDPQEPLTGLSLTAINAGARLGVIGPAIPATPALLDPLRTMQVNLQDQQGNELGKGLGAAILEHPLNAVIWIARDLAESGQKLKAGDLLSLGSFTAPIPPKPGQEVSAIYQGLPGTPQVSVRFR